MQFRDSFNRFNPQICPQISFLGEIWEVFGDLKQFTQLGGAEMRKKNYKGRVVKRYLPKCSDICRTFDPIMTAYADELSKRDDIEEFRCNVYLKAY